MNDRLSPNAQVILLLTAPLIIGQSRAPTKPLTASEYHALACRLRELKRQPADLLEPGSRKEIPEWGFELETHRLQLLLDRGFLLAQAIERWRTRAIWVLSRADPSYPTCLKKRLREYTPPILYGCGDASILNTGGLAVVGSRKLHDTLVEYSESIGRLTARAERTLVSGGAKGADQAAMRGALTAGGRSVGVLADNLEKAVMWRENRDALMDGRLTLICPYDPAARFQVGHAMQRNKLVYALADAALVINSDYRQGGTWAGAVEQLEKFRFVPVYIRSHGECGRGLHGLRERGAIPWPDPKTPESLEMCLTAHRTLECRTPEDGAVSSSVRDEPPTQTDEPQDAILRNASSLDTDASLLTPAEQLFSTVTTLLDAIDGPRTVTRVAEYLNVSKSQAGDWLKRFQEAKLREMFERTDEPKTEAQLAEMLQISGPQIRTSLKRMLEDGTIEKVSHPRPTRYRRTGAVRTLFDGHD